MNEDFLKTMLVADLEKAGFDVIIQSGKCVIEKGDRFWVFADAGAVYGFAMAVDYFVGVD